MCPRAGGNEEFGMRNEELGILVCPRAGGALKMAGGGLGGGLQGPLGS